MNHPVWAAVVASGVLTALFATLIHDGTLGPFWVLPGTVATAIGWAWLLRVGTGSIQLLSFRFLLVYEVSYFLALWPISRIEPSLRELSGVTLAIVGLWLLY